MAYEAYKQADLADSIMQPRPLLLTLAALLQTGLHLEQGELLAIELGSHAVALRRVCCSVRIVYD